MRTLATAQVSACGCRHNAAVQKHLAVAGKVVGGREEPGVTGNAEHPRRRRIVNLAQEYYIGGDIIVIELGPEVTSLTTDRFGWRDPQRGPQARNYVLWRKLLARAKVSKLCVPRV